MSVNIGELKAIFEKRKNSNVDRTGFRAVKPMAQMQPMQSGMAMQGGQMQPPQLPFGGHREYGGEVDPNQTYDVDENGPETYVTDTGQVMPLDSQGTAQFTPPEQGTIIPNQSAAEAYSPMGSGDVPQLPIPNPPPDSSMQGTPEYQDYQQQMADPQAMAAGDAPQLNTAGVNPMPDSADTPPVDPRMVGRQPYRRNSTLDDAANQKLQGVIDAVNAPQAPQSKWKNAAIIATEIANNVFNPQNQVPIRGWGATQHAQGIQKALNQLAPLEQQQEIQGKLGLQQGQANWYNQRGPLAQEGLDQKRYATDQNNATKLQLGQMINMRLNQRADVKAGTAKPVINSKGQMELEFLNTDSKGFRKPNELVKGADGQPITVPGEEGVAWKNPITGQTETIKAKQDVSYATQQQRTDETGRHNKVVEALSADKFNQAKDQFNKTFTLHQQTFQALQDARAKGDTQKANEYQLQLNKSNDQIEQMRLHLEEGLTRGDLNQDQYNELKKFYDQ